MTAGRLGAILLAGGRGSRMGGVHKPLLQIGGQTLLDAAVAAARAAECDPIVVVGPVDNGHSDLTWVREDPPFGGPAAAIIAALPLLDTQRALILACDLPRAVEAVTLLMAAPEGEDGACLTDADGRRQWLTGVYATDALRAAATAMPDAGRDAPVRSLLGRLAIAEVAASDDPAADIAFDVDTWDDLHAARKDEARRRRRTEDDARRSAT